MKTAKSKLKHICVACKEKFQYRCLLKYHIRRRHFNRVGIVPYADSQNINEVWFEKVAKTSTIVEIQKVGENVLLIQKLKEECTIPTIDIKEAVLDVRNLYPLTSSSTKEACSYECCVCQDKFRRNELGKHFAACHPHLIKKRCEVCDAKFKRLFNCASHVCPENSINITIEEETDDLIVVD